MEEVCEGKDFSFPKQEEKILEFWSQVKAFDTQLARTKDKPHYIFYDGPPFATGLPHYGHILAGTIKDVVTRYQSMRGHHVTRRFGWDCHGLPVENEIDKKLGIKKREDVLKMGIDMYNEECRSIVTRYVQEWEKVVTRTGRWIDFKNDYKTMDLNFMESVWWVFAQLYAKDLVYKGFKVMPYSTGCKTPLSNFEAGQNYKDVPDPEIMVTFPVIGDPHNASFVAWTTTPWTLPSNLALCVNANFTYVKVRNKYSGKVYIVAESRLSVLPKEKPKEAVSNGSIDVPKKANAKTKESSSGKAENVLDFFEVLEKVLGSSLVGMKYESLFDYFTELSNAAFRVVADNYVTDDSGTGIVHCAPAFGEDDFRVCIDNQIISKDNLTVAVDDDGCFTDKITDFSGRYIKDADKDIIEAVKYVLEELNIRSLVPCNDTLKYASLRAEPDFSILGKRLGKSMGVVAKEIKAMSQENILAFESAGEVVIANHCLKLTDIKVLRDFKRPDGMTEKEIDAAGDGDVLVILDLRPDESLFEAGAAREIVNRIQKLRKKVALEPTDMVEVYFESLDEDKSVSHRVLHSQESYIRDAIGSQLLPYSLMPAHAVVLGEERFHGISSMSFGITLARPALMFNSKAILSLFTGDTKFAHNLQTYLLSRDNSNLKSEFQNGNGKKIVYSIEQQPAVEVVLGEHVFLTVGDYYLAGKAD